MPEPTSRDQSADAQHLYDKRAGVYDDSWHPRFARHVVELANLKPGEHILDLACGTGLVSYPASAAVGPAGSVTGVDISTGMLAQAEAKKTGHSLSNVEFHQHSITDLASLPALEGRKFDVVICASALVLLEHPAKALQQWTSHLKTGGRVVTDATHPRSQIVFMTFERVGRKLGRPVPWYRVPYQTPDDLRSMIEAAGLHDVNVKFVSQMTIPGTEALEDYLSDLNNPRIEQVFDAADADQFFDKHIDNWAESGLATADVREPARNLFKEEWTKLADADGKVKEVDGVFVGIGFKPIVKHL